MLGDLSEGFSDIHPISVARWPNINMGVLFLNMTLPGPFQSFFDEYAKRSIEYCMNNKASQGLDQDIMIQMLAGIEPLVHKLHDAVWNHQVRNDTTKEDVAACRPTTKILHLVGKGGGPKREREWKGLMKRVL